MITTSISLLEQVRQSDPAAWSRLCHLYGPIIYGWCRRAGLQPADAADVTQEVFRTLYQHIQQFQPGSFRGWLHQVVVNQVRLFFRRQGRQPRSADLTERAAQAESALSAIDEVQTRHLLIHRALGAIQGDFSARTWDIFTRLVLQGQPVHLVADEFNATPNSVRQIRFRVLKRLREQLDGLV
jgi:RNA polymerase sigma-70 factor (ECF subfamily)